MNELSRKISMLSFVLNDVQLFLDTHPMDESAINFYAKYRALFNQAVKEYEENCGPLTPAGVNLENGWSWATLPWPWETGE